VHEYTESVHDTADTAVHWVKNIQRKRMTSRVTGGRGSRHQWARVCSLWAAI